MRWNIGSWCCLGLLRFSVDTLNTIVVGGGILGLWRSIRPYSPLCSLNTGLVLLTSACLHFTISRWFSFDIVLCVYNIGGPYTNVITIEWDTNDSCNCNCKNRKDEIHLATQNNIILSAFSPKTCCHGRLDFGCFGLVSPPSENYTHVFTSQSAADLSRDSRPSPYGKSLSSEAQSS